MLKKRAVDQKLIIVIIGIMVFAGLVYWYGVRPHLIAKRCYDVALENSGYREDDWQMWARNSNAQADYMFIHTLCLQKEGVGLR